MQMEPSLAVATVRRVETRRVQASVHSGVIRRNVRQAHCRSICQAAPLKESRRKVRSKLIPTARNCDSIGIPKSVKF
jgi:hypothetical protein